MTLPVREIVARWRPGSGDWSWMDEAGEIADTIGPLTDSVAREGVREAILLGDDGRVWDGHHRVLAALLCGPDTPIPVEYGVTR